MNTTNNNMPIGSFWPVNDDPSNGRIPDPNKPGHYLPYGRLNAYCAVGKRKVDTQKPRVPLVDWTCYLWFKGNGPGVPGAVPVSRTRAWLVGEVANRGQPMHQGVDMLSLGAQHREHRVAVRVMLMDAQGRITPDPTAQLTYTELLRDAAGRVTGVSQPVAADPLPATPYPEWAGAGFYVIRAAGQFDSGYARRDTAYTLTSDNPQVLLEAFYLNTSYSPGYSTAQGSDDGPPPGDPSTLA